MKQNKRGGCLRNFVALIVLASILYFSRERIYSALGHALVSAEEPSKAGVIVVLGGDGYGLRLFRAEELARQGFAPEILVSGPTGNFEIPECTLSIEYARKRGYSTAAMRCFPIDGKSTVEEVRILREELKRTYRAKRILCVTSDYHTRRTARVWRQEAPELDVHVVASPDKYFRPDGWWKHREGQKIFVLEWAKTFAHFVGL